MVKIKISKLIVTLYIFLITSVVYANDYKMTYALIKLMPLKDYSGEELKNLQSFKRWSNFKRYLR